ncbi:reverse transcriptase domain-containing protein [Citrus sinensis]|uniref:Reverse transcriptase domain-containing protein n=1 Tax=Citrus sinensis TaxID=2711 RepID=A0ACB8INC9_CITSI|nr:reverse transcriptase domain-containing protein [Citrus sinensis]
MCFKRKRKPRVHYEDMWSHYEECRQIVEEELRQRGSRYDRDPVQSFQKAANCSIGRLLAWSKKEFNNRKEKLKRLKKKLGDMKLNYQHFKEAKDFKSTEDQIEMLLLDEEVSAGMNEQLDRPFIEEEVTAALAQMCPTKAPGPDGLPAAFFQKHWKSVKSSVISTSLYILNDKGIISPLNHTHIVLIPNIQKPERVTNFRPISLCNVIYRVIAKTIANRLKDMLNHVISPSQSAFIPNRMITDNIIVGYECLHKIRHNKGKKHGLVALKLDLSNAYDRVEWSFLKHTMLKLGFSSNLVDFILNCISTSFSIVINGVVSGMIKPQRGLRQGCPLSPYLFIICAEVFSNLLAQAEQKKLIQGLRFGKEVSVSHLLFADDSLIFVRAAVEDCSHLKAVFECYSRASGQIFNYQKSSMFFSQNTEKDRATAIKDIFQLQVVSRHEKYLGLPSMVGRKSKSFFNDVKLRVLNKIQGWQHKFFSSGGKKVLIKAVAQAVPTFAMSVFKIPLGLCEEIQKEVAKFWPVLDPAIRVDSTVAELIDGQQRWKEGLIHDSFAREDAEAIPKIPLPKRPKEDQLIWHYDRRGKYYLVVPEKIKIFLWRAINNILPTSENLWKMRVVQKPICQICNSNVETISHALLGCKMAKKIWRSSQFPDMLVESKSHDISGMFQGLTKKQHISKMETIAALLWVTGLGVVVRDWKSNCIAAAIKTSGFFGSVSMAEAAAMD